jgi:hypothetical protein
MRIKTATSKPSSTVILSEAKNLGSFAPDRKYEPEMFRFAQHDNPIEEMSSSYAS